MAGREEAENPFDVRLQTASGDMLDVCISVVAVRNGRKRPAILHLLSPMAHTAETRNQSEDSQPIVTKQMTSTNLSKCR